MSDKAAIIGYSGHGYVVAEASILAGVNLMFYTEKNEQLKNPFGLEYLGFEGNETFKDWDENIRYILAIGDNHIRRKTGNYIQERGRQLLTIIHPSSSVSPHSEIGNGTFIARNASVNPLATVGQFCILNTGSVIEHECMLEDAVHVAPGAVLAGNVFVGENSFIGANSVIKQGVVIGKNVIIGAGAVILKNVPDGLKIVGNPGKMI